MVSLDSVTFSTTGLVPQGDQGGSRVWHTVSGDGVGLFYFPLPPDIEADVDSLPALASYYSKHLKAANARGILLTVYEIDRCRVIKQIVRLAFEPQRAAYIGSLTLPFRDFSFVVKVQCIEQGITGAREAVVIERLLASGEVKVSEARGLEGWERPLDTFDLPRWKINRAEAAEYDAQFPNHPLSILRRTLAQIEGSLKIADDVKREPIFRYHENGR